MSGSGGRSPEFNRLTVWTQVGRLLRALRERRGFSVPQLARRAGLSPDLIVAYEAGRERFPGFEACWRLTTALGVDLLAFLKHAQGQAGVSLLADVTSPRAGQVRQERAVAATSPEEQSLSAFVADLQGHERA